MSDKRTAWLVGVGAFLLLAPGAFFGLPFGKYVVGATRILSGEIPYRDFWTMYAPGSFYAIAALFALFGRELLVQGLAICALTAASSAVLFLLLRDAGANRRLALLGALVLALSRWHTNVELTSYEPALLLALLAFRSVLAMRLVRAGFLLGAAAIFKHDFAAYAAAGSAIALLLRRENPLPLLASALAVVLPAVLLLAWQAGSDAWQDLVVFPATDFPHVRGERYPHLLPRSAPLAAWVAHPSGVAQARDAAFALGRWIGCFLPELFFLAGLAVAFLRRGSTPPALLLALALLPFFWLAAHVQQNTHVHTMALLSMIVFATAWTTRALPRAALGIAAAVHAAGLLVAPALGVVSMVRALPDAGLAGMPGTSLVIVPRETHDAVCAVADYVQKNVPDQEPIYVGLERHDATVISSPILYFLCDRRPAVRYHELHPGITDREDVQKEMLGRIEGLGVRCAILWRFGWPKGRLDAVRDRNRRAVRGASSSVLDGWIAQHFSMVASHGEYGVCWRRQ